MGPNHYRKEKNKLLEKMELEKEARLNGTYEEEKDRIWNEGGWNKHQ